MLDFHQHVLHYILKLVETPNVVVVFASSYFLRYTYSYFQQKYNFQHIAKAFVIMLLWDTISNVKLFKPFSTFLPGTKQTIQNQDAQTKKKIKGNEKPRIGQ